MGAYVLVAGTRLGAVADSSGRYTIGKLPPGTYRLSAEMLGYKPRILRGVVVRPGRTTSLIVVDRVPVFNPYRLKLLGGPVSMFNPDMVERVELLPGGFPARYGDRLAAVLVVDNREGDRGRGHWRGGASLIDMRAALEGPLPGSRQDGSWIAATRRTWYDPSPSSTTTGSST